jgi:hypothetical protein
VSATIHFDTKEFDQAIRQYAAQSRRDFAEICNAKAKDLAFESLRLTHRADANRMRQELSSSVAQKIVISHKTGRTKGGAMVTYHYDESGRESLAARLVNWRRAKAGEPMLWGTKLEEAARRLVAARVRSVSFVRSGWLPAIRRLGGAGGQGARQVGVPKGYAVPAQPGVSPVSAIVNTALSSEGAGSRLAALAEAGLRLAYAAVTRDMQAYMERKLQQTANRFSS